MIIAIDGPAASGKGTLGRKIATHYGLGYLDTGLLYRALARDMLAEGLEINDPEAAAAAAGEIDAGTLDDPHLRDPGIGEVASIVAGIPQVRQVLLAFQRAFATKPPGAVLDGRDIGTVVCPDADVKIFVNAAPEIRARRRFTELRAGGDPITEDDVLQMIRRRDARDAERAFSPMRPAQDAHLLETSDLGIEAAFDAAVAWIERKIGR